MLPIRSMLWPVLLVVAFGIGASWRLAVGQEQRSKTVQKWEYTYGMGYSDEQLKRMGDDGWELVAATFQRDYPTLYFKRQK